MARENTCRTTHSLTSMSGVGFCATLLVDVNEWVALRLHHRGEARAQRSAMDAEAKRWGTTVQELKAAVERFDFIVR